MMGVAEPARARAGAKDQARRLRREKERWRGVNATLKAERAALARCAHSSRPGAFYSNTTRAHSPYTSPPYGNTEGHSISGEDRGG
jgi:hypothetical protein